MNLQKNGPTYKDEYKEVSKMMKLCDYFGEEYSGFIQLKNKQKIKKGDIFTHL